MRNEDCDDEDDTVYPGAPAYDGVDSNCDYKSDFDSDGDGDDLAWQEDDRSPVGQSLSQPGIL